jgi:hypothetical protein
LTPNSASKTRHIHKMHIDLGRDSMSNWQQQWTSWPKKYTGSSVNKRMYNVHTLSNGRRCLL